MHVSCTRVYVAKKRETLEKSYTFTEVAIKVSHNSLIRKFKGFGGELQVHSTLLWDAFDRRLRKLQVVN